MATILEEFDEYVMETEIYAQRGKALKERAHSTANLVCHKTTCFASALTNICNQLSDLLSYEEGVGLKDLTKETQLESKSMHQLTERSTKDAAAVKILTVITLVYLPTALVAVSFPRIL